jgi:hypothetical protein
MTTKPLMEMIAITIDFGGVKHRSKNYNVKFFEKELQYFDTQQHKFSSMLCLQMIFSHSRQFIRKNAHESLRQNYHFLKNDNTFCLNVTKSHLCTLVKVFVFST